MLVQVTHETEFGSVVDLFVQASLRWSRRRRIGRALIAPLPTVGRERRLFFAARFMVVIGIVLTQTGKPSTIQWGIMKRIMVIAAAAAIGGGTLGIGSYALATTSSPVIHACYERTAPHTLEHSASASCPKGYTALKWDITGPQGPAGLKGATGATGAQGPAGPSTAGSTGLDVTVISVIQTGEGTGTSVTVDCPSAEPYVLGGGYLTGSGNTVYENYPLEPEDGFEGRWVIEGTISASGSIEAYAICSK